MVTFFLAQEKSLERRLIHEREILEASTKFLRAKVALQSAFTPETPETPISAEGLTQAPVNDEPQSEQPTSADGNIASEDRPTQERSPEGSQSADQGSDKPGQDSADSS